MYFGVQGVTFTLKFAVCSHLKKLMKQHFFTWYHPGPSETKVQREAAQRPKQAVIKVWSLTDHEQLLRLTATGFVTDMNSSPEVQGIHR